MFLGNKKCRIYVVLWRFANAYFNANRERVMYPMATFDEDPDLSTSGPQDQVSVGQIIETEDGKEKVIAVDGQGAYVTEVIDQ